MVLIMLKMATIIHAENGLTLFSKSFERFCFEIEDQEDLVGCFISAMESFSKQFGQEGLRSIEMTDLEVLIYKKLPISVIFVADKDENLEEYKHKIAISANTFVKKYEKEIQASANNTAFFEGFNADLQEILELPMEEITLACPHCDFEEKCDCIYVQLQKKLVIEKK